MAEEQSDSLDRYFSRCLKIFLLLGLLFFSGRSEGQTSNSWARIYSSDEIGYAHSVLPTTDGGYVVSGYKEFYAGDDFDTLCLLMKLDGNGEKIWEWTSDEGKCSVHDMMISKDGHCVLTGTSSKSQESPYDIDMWAASVDINGKALWTTTWRNPGHEDAHKIGELDDGGYLVVGISDDYSGDDGPIVARLDSEGRQKSYKILKMSSQSFIHDAVIEGDGSVVLLIYFFDTFYDSAVAKYDASGNRIWQRKLGGEFFDPVSIMNDREGNYLVAGTYFSGLVEIPVLLLTNYRFSIRGKDFRLIKLNNDGRRLWARSYGDSYDQELEAASMTSDEGVLMTGTEFFYTEPPSMLSRVAVAKIKRTGGLEWLRKFNRPRGCKEGGFIHQTPDGGYILLAGIDTSLDSDFRGEWILKLDSEGRCLGPGCPDSKNLDE